MDWIYRILPFAYIVLGLIVATEMDSLLATGSGVLLGITGLLIWKMRVDFRREIGATKAKRSATQPTVMGRRRT